MSDFFIIISTKSSGFENDTYSKHKKSFPLKSAIPWISHFIIFPSQVFKMDWLLMSIVLLCIMAMFLYALINILEHIYMKRLS